MSNNAISSPSAPAARPARLELRFLDGLRALAALYVVLHHAYCKPGVDGAVSMPWWSNWLFYGNFAVDVFIVLSGFLLALPVATSAGRTLEGGLKRYFQRRARRILPPYYAALVLSCLLLLGGALLASRVGGGERDLAKHLSAGSLGTHLLLIHNVFPAWHKVINAPLWSVATEWQIYFVFALVLIPLWRRAGIAVALAAGLALGIVPRLFGWEWADAAQTWQLGLFCLGMVTANVFARWREAGRDMEARGLWGWVAALLAAGICLTVSFQPRWYEPWGWCFDLAVGAMTACIILFCAPVAVRPELARRPAILRVMESGWAQGVGRFSYSLYLTHSPLLAFVWVLVRKLNLPLGPALLVLLALGTVVSLVAAYLFYLAFERPFLGRHTVKTPRGASAASTPVVSAAGAEPAAGA
jgi:peptidoglycan/LPS O-acetylase OafA/YrhL